VVEVLGDCAYGAGETRAEFAAAGRTLIAKVPDLQNQGYFAKTDFQIDLEAGTCTCPNQRQTREFRSAKGGGGVFVFDADTCAVCPLRPQCTRSRGGRTVQVHPQEALLQHARRLQKSPAFAEVRRRRQVVEHRIARLAHLGMRQARYVGRTKTVFQVCLAAAVANLTLLAATSTALSVPGGDVAGWLLTLLALMLTLSSLLSAVGLAALRIHQSVHPGHFFPTVRPQLPPSRPAF